MAGGTKNNTNTRDKRKRRKAPSKKAEEKTSPRGKDTKEGSNNMKDLSAVYGMPAFEHPLNAGRLSGTKLQPSSNHTQNDRQRRNLSTASGSLFVEDNFDQCLAEFAAGDDEEDLDPCIPSCITIPSPRRRPMPYNDDDDEEDDSDDDIQSFQYHIPSAAGMTPIPRIESPPTKQQSSTASKWAMPFHHSTANASNTNITGSSPLRRVSSRSAQQGLMNGSFSSFNSDVEGHDQSIQPEVSTARSTQSRSSTIHTDRNCRKPDHHHLKNLYVPSIVSTAPSKKLPRANQKGSHNHHQQHRRTYTAESDSMFSDFSIRSDDASLRLAEEKQEQEMIELAMELSLQDSQASVDSSRQSRISRASTLASKSTARSAASVRSASLPAPMAPPLSTTAYHPSAFRNSKTASLLTSDYDDLEDDFDGGGTNLDRLEDEMIRLALEASRRVM